MLPGSPASVFAPTLPLYLLAWVVLGAGMGTGLYDAVFAALGKLYGKEARTPITNLTLFGGFASTVCWPLSAFLAETVGWRGACLVYAGLHLCVSLPLQMAVMPRLSALPKADAVAGMAADKPQGPRMPLQQYLIVCIARAGADHLRRHWLDRGRAPPDLPAGERNHFR